MRDIPRPPSKIKPDWSAPETAPVDSTRYYQSTRAIGRLFRSIDLPAIRTARRAVHYQQQHMVGGGSGTHADVLSGFIRARPRQVDTIWPAVRQRVAQFINASRAAYSSDEVLSVWDLYNSYVSQLRVICTENTISYARDSMLAEEEAVVSYYNGLDNGLLTSCL